MSSPDVSILQLTGTHTEERWSVIWHCPICRRGASVFFADFDLASAWMELVMLDLRCAACRRNQEVRV